MSRLVEYAKRKIGEHKEFIRSRESCLQYWIKVKAMWENGELSNLEDLMTGFDETKLDSSIAQEKSLIKHHQDEIRDLENDLNKLLAPVENKLADAT